MSEKERARPTRTGFTADPDDHDDLDAARSNAERLLRTADEAIARALSTDSERYLEATRQSGGQ